MSDQSAARAPTDDAKPGLLGGFSPTTQALVSAVFLVPTLWVFYLWWRMPIIEDPTESALAVAAFTLVQDIYLISVLALMARGNTRSIQALLVAAIALCVDIALCFVPQTTDAEVFVLSVIYTLSLVGSQRGRLRGGLPDLLGH